MSLSIPILLTNCAYPQWYFVLKIAIIPNIQLTIYPNLAVQFHQEKSWDKLRFIEKVKKITFVKTDIKILLKPYKNWHFDGASTVDLLGETNGIISILFIVDDMGCFHYYFKNNKIGTGNNRNLRKVPRRRWCSYQIVHLFLCNINLDV